MNAECRAASLPEVTHGCMAATRLGVCILQDSTRILRELAQIACIQSPPWAQLTLGLAGLAEEPESLYAAKFSMLQNGPPAHEGD